MYGALNRVGKYCSPGNWVAIMGAGGGLGHLYVYTFGVSGLASYF